jgi:hypothetical protein
MGVLALVGTRKGLFCSGPTMSAITGRPRNLCSTAGAFFTRSLTKGDGVVRWQAQLVPFADCVEVSGSHVGLVLNRKSYRVIARALAAPELPGGEQPQ